MPPVRILGGGPAGTAAALAALGDGCAVELYENRRYPRHKVCGEFLSPGTGRILEEFGLWGEFSAARPARIRRLVLHFGARAKACTLPEPGFGLSRYALDRLLLEAAKDRGAAVSRNPPASPPSVIATGRAARASRGNRLFGFKAHFHGPADDAVELFFFSGAYVGINTVEEDRTNVCGLAPEPFLRAHGFDFDSVLCTFAPLAARTGPLSRAMDWLAAGPVSFEREFRSARGPYRAGDALGFVDPFTGTGILNALLTGRLAGTAAARAVPPETYVRQCRRALVLPFEVASLFRAALRSGWADLLGPLLPAGLLFRLSRPL